MVKFAIDLYKKYEEAVNYLFFGFLAFVVNMAAYALAAWVLGMSGQYGSRNSLAGRQMPAWQGFF